jgi:two-component system, sensor histidine kinase PdtaS
MATGMVDVSTLPRDVARQLELLAAVARRTGNAVVVTDPQQNIEWVNDGFVRLTGYSLEDVIGRRPGFILQGPDTDAAVARQMAQAIAEESAFDVEILNYSKDGRQYWVRIEAEPTRDDAGRLTGFIAIETDVTERRIAAARERLTRQIGEKLLRCDSIESAARVVVDRLVETYDIRAAAVWTVERGHPTLHFVAGAVSGPASAEWMEVTSTRTFARGNAWVVGVGAPGVAWGTAAPCQKTDFWEKDQYGQYSRRAKAAQNAGIRTVCAVPVLGPEGVLAVIEFGGSHAYPGYERLPALLEQVAQAFGAFVVQHQSLRAFKVLFQYNPDALMVVDAAGRIASANARAVTLFGPIEGTLLSQWIEHATVLLASSAGVVSQAVHEHTARRTDGSSFGAELTLSPSTETGAPWNIVAVRDLTERHRAEEALRRSLAEKVTLVQEVHHRVKNNLQILSSLISIQAGRLEDPNLKAMLRNTEHRIQSMALVHKYLYSNNDLARIGFGSYAQTLCTALRGSLAPTAELELKTGAVELSLELAVPAGLILNELVTNAFKYGKREDGGCYVRVEVEAIPGGFAFSVSDLGPGFPAVPARQNSMGTALVRALLGQLRARRIVGSGPGASVRVEIPLEVDDESERNP